MKLPDATLRKFIYPDPTPDRAVKVKRFPKGRKSGKGPQGESMNRAHNTEVAAVRERLVTAAKATAPVTRRAAQQMSDDLYQWERWTLEGVALPRLPRRIRVGLAKPVKPRNKKGPTEKIISENILKPTAHATKQIEGALDPEILLEWLAADRTHLSAYR